MVKQEFIAANYGEEKIIWVSPKDITVAIADEIVMPLEGRKVHYLSSDEHTCNETAAVLGAVIGNPDLKWTVVPINKCGAVWKRLVCNPLLLPV